MPSRSARRTSAASSSSGSGLEQAAVDIAAKRDLIAIQAFYFGQVYSALRIKRMQGVGAALDHLLQDRPLPENAVRRMHLAKTLPS